GGLKGIIPHCGKKNRRIFKRALNLYIKLESNKKMKQNMLPLNQKPGFKVPENYFREFDAGLMAKLNENHILDGTYKGDPGFKTPEAYFDDLEGKIFHRIEETRNKGKVI